jgi:hypothetical protein
VGEDSPDFSPERLMNRCAVVSACALALALSGSALALDAQERRSRSSVVSFRPNHGIGVSTPALSTTQEQRAEYRQPSRDPQADADVPDLSQRIVGASFGSLSGLFAGLLAGQDVAFIAAPLASVAGSALGSRYVAGGGTYWLGSTLGAMLGSLAAYSFEGPGALLTYSAVHGAVAVLVGSR